MPLEVERKYLDVDFDVLRQRLRQCGAHGGQAHLERNRLYDLPDGSLRAGHRLLRLRTQEWRDPFRRRTRPSRCAKKRRASCRMPGRCTPS